MIFTQKKKVEKKQKAKNENIFLNFSLYLFQRNKPKQELIFIFKQIIYPKFQKLLLGNCQENENETIIVLEDRNLT